MQHQHPTAGSVVTETKQTSLLSLLYSKHQMENKQLRRAKQCKHFVHLLSRSVTSPMTSELK